MSGNRTCQRAAIAQAGPSLHKLHTAYCVQSSYGLQNYPYFPRRSGFYCDKIMVYFLRIVLKNFYY